jgi:hypothetical protein
MVNNFETYLADQVGVENETWSSSFN